MNNQPPIQATEDRIKTLWKKYRYGAAANEQKEMIKVVRTPLTKAMQLLEHPHWFEADEKIIILCEEYIAHKNRIDGENKSRKQVKANLKWRQNNSTCFSFWLSNKEDQKLIQFLQGKYQPHFKSQVDFLRKSFAQFNANKNKNK